MGTDTAPLNMESSGSYNSLPDETRRGPLEQAFRRRTVRDVLALVDDLDVMLRTAERAAMAGGPPAGAPEKSVHMGTRKRPSSREAAEQVMEA